MSGESKRSGSREAHATRSVKATMRKEMCVE